MAEYRVRFVAENGSDSTGDGTAANPFRLPSKAVADLGTAGGLHVNPGVIMIGEGDFTETSTVQITRDVIIQGVGGYQGGVGGTRWIRGHSGDFVKYDTGFTDWQNHFHVFDLTMDGNKGSFPAAANLLTIYKPGFNTSLRNVNFRDSSGWGLVVEQGANNLHAYNLGFLGNVSGAIYHFSTTAGSGFGQWCAYWGLQIDGVASGTADGILIEQDKASRSMFLFDFPEFETGFTNGIRTNLTSAATSVAVVVNSMVTQGTTYALRETGTNPALWVINHCSTSGQLFNGINENDTRGNCGFHTFGTWDASGFSGIQMGEIDIRTSTANPTHSAPTGSLHIVKNGASSRLYQNTSATDPGTTWTQIT